MACDSTQRCSQTIASRSASRCRSLSGSVERRREGDSVRPRPYCRFMSYDVAVWLGPQPADNVEALARYAELTAAAQDTGRAAPPLLAFLREVRRVLTDGEAWASEPSEEAEADGSLMHLHLSSSSSVHDLAQLTDAAHRHGLVVFDLQGANGGDVYLPLDDGSGYADHIDPPRAAIASATIKKGIRDALRTDLKALGLRKTGPFDWRRDLADGHHVSVQIDVRSREGARDVSVSVTLHLGRDPRTGYQIDWSWNLGAMLATTEWEQVNADLEARRVEEPEVMEQAISWLEWKREWERLDLWLPVTTDDDLAQWLPTIKTATVRTCQGLLAEPRRLPDVRPFGA